MNKLAFGCRDNLVRLWNIKREPVAVGGRGKKGNYRKQLKISVYRKKRTYRKKNKKNKTLKYRN
jgi:hypothetical protein